MPSSDGCDDLVGSLVQRKCFGFWLASFDEAVDGSLQGDDSVEYAAFKPAVGQLGEETLDGVDP